VGGEELTGFSEPGFFLARSQVAALCIAQPASSAAGFDTGGMETERLRTNTYANSEA
jgi:hypothetical protein